MPAKDLFHDAVKNALIKEGWTITDDPLTFKIDGINISIDLGAEKIIGAEKDGEKIAVEIKSFISPSPLTEFHAALGQTLNYRLFLEEENSDRQIFLAIPVETYREFFLKNIIQKAVKINQIKIIVYDSINEVIELWIS
ncbi:MAG: XisH family protein [Pyrinomonadaceae bacterium]